MPRSRLAHGPDLHVQGTPYTRAQGAPYPQGSSVHAQGAPFTRPGPSSSLCKQALSPHHAPVGGPHIAGSRPFTKAPPKPQSQGSHFTASHPLSAPPDPPAPPPPPPLPPSAASLPESVGAAAASVGRHASGSGHVGESGSQLQDNQQQQQQQQQQQWQQQQEVQGNQQQGQRQGQQEQQQRMGGGLKVMARLSSSDSPSPVSSSPGGMVGMLHSLRQQAAAAWGGGNTDTGACGAAASPREEGGASMLDGEMSTWEGGTCEWEYNAVTSSQGNRARSGCAVAEGFEHISVPEPHRADASAADVQLDLSESHRRPSQHQQQQSQPGFGSGLRHISLPSISPPSPPNADSSTHLEQQSGRLTPRSSHTPFSKMQDEQQGSATARPLGGGSGFHSAPPGNVTVGQQRQQQQQQQQQQNRPKGSVSPFQIQQPAQGPIQGILHMPARLHSSSSCQPQG
ncbi:hypothetical protein DUNSADRAFT_6073 [Dunaliella salina]|uniref:Uncharacterized protein n=1 Tax=Dunaliella salina TaxID=3046 RepID=A0ABQ7FUV0_DUNSA|nr:hypothetical protein DUNSADRAFT_6073 [Dunaliella salina]|eukprot:KAF5825896.1 hypothetical protein DUNSADRAFT_6073 [Dunaliella salina]